MARGVPAIWSTLVGAPFVVTGATIYLQGGDIDPITGIPILGFGLFVIGIGLYINVVAAPDPPTMRDGEELVATRNPAQRAALAKTVVGFGGLAATGYLLFFTLHPYVYPTVTFVVGLYLFSTGLYTYWTNTLTTYYVTNRRLIKEYRFLSLVRQEIAFEKVRAVEERKSVWEAIVGLGNVQIASGGGGALSIAVRNIYQSNTFADEIRNLL